MTDRTPPGSVPPLTSMPPVVTGQASAPASRPPMTSLPPAARDAQDRAGVIDDLREQLAEQSRQRAELAGKLDAVTEERNELRDMLQRQANERADSIAELAAELERTRQACQTLGMVVTRHGRTMQAAWIDLVRGDPAAAQETLGVETEGIPELQTWNGTETGTEWLRRTETEDS